MPDNEKSDIDYQPKTQGYSYSSKNNASNNNRLYLLIGVVLLIIIVLSSILYLNNSTKKDTVSNLEVKTNPTPASPTPFDYGTNKLSQQQIEESQAYVKEKNFASKTSVRKDGKSFAVDGIFSGFGKQQIQLVTADGIMNFSINSSTSFEEMSLTKADKNSENTIFTLSKTYTLNTFFEAVKLGKVIQIYYTDYGNSNLAATKVVYYPDLK